jgi:phosphatidate cytidylyltransferase|tara:strand:- start:10842 stop:11507 length:666 start_codon:yes stop_codon:yes gene_type:complete
MTSLQSRVLIGLIGFPSVIYIILNHIFIFNTIVVICFVLAFKEFVEIVNRFKDKTVWLIFGLIYIFGSMVSLIYLRNIDSIISSPFTFLVFAGVMVNDSMAFIVGKTLGGPKILPKISPKKTYSGLFGGLVGSIIFILLCDNYFLNSFTEFSLNNTDKIFLIFVFNIVGFFGDSFESMIKRKADVKDSSGLLLGHGGMLDRLDSLILTTPVTMFYVIAYYL